MAERATKNYIWFSCDPVRGKIDVYPRFFAERIETGFRQGADFVRLGEFFDATVHLRGDRFCQTTPSFDEGPNAQKQGGFRNVVRCEISERHTGVLFCIVGTKHCFRIASAQPSTAKPASLLTEQIWYDLQDGGGGDEEAAGTWTEQMLDVDGVWFVVWQWCSAKEVKISDVNLEDWICYDEDWNRQIEDEFQRHKRGDGSGEVALGTSRVYNVVFMADSIYAVQRHAVHSEDRKCVRRVVLSAAQIKSALQRETPKTVYVDDKCPITHLSIHDPVVVCDGYVYERDAIEKWLSQHETSPMTGLPLRTRRFQKFVGQ